MEVEDRVDLEGERGGAMEISPVGGAGEETKEEEDVIIY